MPSFSSPIRVSSSCSTSERTSLTVTSSRSCCPRLVTLSRRRLPSAPGCSSITVGATIQFSGLTFAPPASENTMKVPSALIISSRTASGSTVLRRPA